MLLAELRKAVTLPAVWAGGAVALLGSLAITWINAGYVRSAVAAGTPERVAGTSPIETAFAAAPLGTVGAVVIGVVLVSSEYTAHTAELGGGRQITATLTAVPRRAALLAAKATAAVLLTVVVAALTLPASVALARAVIGEAGTETVEVGDAVVRCLSMALYWTLMGLLALSITVLTRSGALPLLVLVVNSSLVSVPYLLTRVTPLANWLPDMAGRALFGGFEPEEGWLDPVPGALVMAAWAVAGLVVAAVVMRRRDA